MLGRCVGTACGGSRISSSCGQLRRFPKIGSRISRTAIPLAAVLVLGASPFQMGILNGAGAAGILVFGLFTGAWADRLRRRPILIAADLGRAALLGSIPLAAAFGR